MAACQLDVHGAARPTIDADHRVLDPVAAIRAVRNTMQLAGFRVAFGVSGVPVGHCSVKVADTYGFQLVGQLVGCDTGLHQREGLACMSDHVGVWADWHGAEAPDRRPLAQRLGYVRTTHPAVAVPLRLAVADADAVHHAVGHKPVMT
jgi:hypothetical protein